MADNTLVGTSGSFQINLIWDTSVQNLAVDVKTAFEAAVELAASTYTNVISNNMVVNLQIGYGEVGGTALSAGALGNSSQYMVSNNIAQNALTYSDVATAIKTVDGAGNALQQSAAASLPTSDPSALTQFAMPNAEAQVLGFAPVVQTVITTNTVTSSTQDQTAANNGIDGYIGFINSPQAPLSYTLASTMPAADVAAKDYDLVSIAQHEISEVMGRVSSINSGALSAEDLFRYSAAGTSNTTVIAAALPLSANQTVQSTNTTPSGVYLSADGGKTAIATFNSEAGGDFGDWNGATSDSFNASGGPGVVDPVTTADFQTLSLLGYTVNASAICFMAGTMIRTPAGEAPIESLKPGDLVVTMEGEAQPVRWLGKQTISSVFADPLRNWQVRVMAGALGDNVPGRDLLVSPDHALLVDDVLIHAGALVNGTSIVRETTVPRTFVYYHVELDDHSLILAENTPVETFVDNVDRMNFDNWAEHEALYPEGRAIAEMDTPRAKARRQVPARIRLALDLRGRDIVGPLEAAAA